MASSRGFAVAMVAALALAGAVAVTGRASLPPEGRSSDREIRTVLGEQVAAWNRGDIDAFMEGYDKSDATRFASGGSVTRGWKTVLARYKARYDTREKMGTLTFSDLEIEALEADTAIAFGRWRLDYPSAKPAGGLFTLMFKKRPAGWRIVADHTSSE